jgi:hypothetical protein
VVEYEPVGPCQLSSILSNTLPDACTKREAHWSASECPLRTGGRIDCFYCGDGGCSSLAAKVHGCAEASVMQTRSRLSEALHLEAGHGPPNPFCMTIFPPSWRITDWCARRIRHALPAHKPATCPLRAAWLLTAHDALVTPQVRWHVFGVVLLLETGSISVFHSVHLYDLHPPRALPVLFLQMASAWHGVEERAAGSRSSLRPAARLTAVRNVPRSIPAREEGDDKQRAAYTRWDHGVSRVQQSPL